MRTLVIIPTYQERQALPETLARTRAAVPGADVLVADDASPDGTGVLADEFAALDQHVHVLHRAGKEGLGRAYVAGFAWALDRGYDVVVEMDADGSHQPEQLPLLLSALAEAHADLALGSRWVPGGRVVNWPRSREILSRGGNAYTRLALGLPVRDATGGYRAYRASALARLPLAEIESQGYCFQVDMTQRIHRAGGRIVEVPIEFVERRAGESKMSRAIVAEALWRVTEWGLQYRGAQAAEAARRATSALRRESLSHQSLRHESPSGDTLGHESLSYPSVPSSSLRQKSPSQERLPCQSRASDLAETP